MKKRMVIKNIIMMNISPFTGDREYRTLFRVMDKTTHFFMLNSISQLLAQVAKVLRSFLKQFMIMLVCKFAIDYAIISE